MVNITDIPESVPETATLTPEKEGLIQELLSKVDEHYTENVPFCIARENTAERRRIFAYRFLTARRWKVKNALEMVKNTVAFRAQHHIDDWKLFPCAFPLKGYDEDALCEMLKTMPGCDALFPREGVDEVDLCYRALQASYVNVYHYWDKEGHPVLYDCCGRANVGQILRGLSRITNPGKSLSDVIVPYHVYMNEVQYYLIEYADRLSRQAGKHPIHGITVVMDMEGLSFRVVRRNFIQVIRAIFEVDQAYYPEVLHRLFVLNAPRFFRVAYDLVKGSLDENTRHKLVFSSSKSEALEILRRVISDDRIPQELGGGCRCEGGCLPRYVEPTTEAQLMATDAVFGVAPEEDVEKEVVYLKAGKEWTHAYALVENGEVAWEFTVANGAEVVFTAAFEPSTLSSGADATSAGHHVKPRKGSLSRTSTEGVDLPTMTVKHEKLNTDMDIFKATNAGTLTLTLSNKHSWIHGKQIEIRVAHIKPLD
ncbi:hypothetical protein ABL78_0070 [Leptomonas seymouri]|uniref:CRAL-TRIO domain-containing protein n=1 Tax=Leptomonas seymouri TaxID=5684 RepID=A0A0N0P9K9_LEPSE|nr:hypothetical protein ABL78_0070 [Leptomonas seymouri]|eukprot:KPI90837.1 hypothetical protein ABL78_0070 [Leptomonas seymouri]